MREALFRKASLDRLASPERLDTLMEVTAPRDWLALWTIGAVLVGVLAWGVFGSIPTRVDGRGILLRGGSLREIKAEAHGVLTALDVTVGGTVRSAQAIGEIAQRDTEDEVNRLRIRYEQLARDLQSARAEDAATAAGYEGDLRRFRAELARLEADLVQKKALLAKGLITRARVDAEEQQVLNLRVEMSNLAASIRSVEQRTRARASDVEMARLEFERASKSAASVTTVKSTVSGRVVEVRKRVGDRVVEGEAVALVEPPSAQLEPLVYVDAAMGKRIKAGMEAQVSPSTVKREEFGFLVGRVRSVGDYPVTPQAVHAVVANEALAQQLLGQSSKIEMWATLQPDPATRSGYAWSSSGGPPFKIDSGTEVYVSVVVDRRAPISYVLPLVRSAYGAR